MKAVVSGPVFRKAKLFEEKRLTSPVYPKGLVYSPGPCAENPEHPKLPRAPPFSLVFDATLEVV